MSEFIQSINSPKPTFNSKNQSFSQTATTKKTLSDDSVNRIRNQSTLTVHFTKKDLDELLGLNDSNGIRFYPAMSKGKAALLAVGMSHSTGDLVFDSNINNPCYISNEDGDALKIPVKDAERMVKDIDGHINSKDFLSSLKSAASGNTNYFKTVFTSDVFNSPEFTNASKIRFDIVKLQFEDDKTAFKTLTASAVDKNGMASDTTHLSLLPCPPHCGGGAYIDE